MEGETLPGMVATALVDLRKAAEVEGVALVELQGPTASEHILLREAGVGVPSVLPTARELLTREANVPSHGMAPDRRPVLVCPWMLPPGRFGGLVMWRTPGARAWSAASHVLAAACGALIRVMLEEGPGEIGLDRLTGLPNRPYFLEEADRHIERLDLDELGGTMMVVSLDRLELLIAQFGQDAGDRVLGRLAILLRAVVRPTDIVARVGTDHFALWLDGMDHMTAAERAENLRQRRLSLADSEIGDPAARPTLSIGITFRRPGSGEDAGTLLRRALLAAREVRNAGGGAWRVAHGAVPRR